METSQKMYLDLLGEENTQFVIPVFQRVYSWNDEQCDGIWMDVVRSGRTGLPHFLGTILYSREPERTPGIKGLAVVDGQQRTTTITLLLIALEEYMRAHDLTVEGIDADFIRTHYLMCGEQHKLVLSRTDRATLFAIIDHAELPARKSERIINNYQWFKNRMEQDDFDPELVVRGLRGLMLISAELVGEDRPQLVFESLNTKGTPLTTGDMVRNYLLIAEDRDEQERLYDTYWKPIEMMFGDDPESEKLNAGIRMWLTIRFVKVSSHDKGETYSVFKTYVESEYDGTLEDLLIELRDFCLMWSENYRDHDIMTGSKEFRSWDWAKGKPTTLIPHRFSQGGF